MTVPKSIQPTPPNGQFGQSSPGRPQVSAQSNDPTYRAAHAGPERKPSRAHRSGLERDDEALQHGSESGTERVAEKKREEDHIDPDGRRRV